MSVSDGAEMAACMALRYDDDDDDEPPAHIMHAHTEPETVYVSYPMHETFKWGTTCMAIAAWTGAPLGII